MANQKARLLEQAAQSIEDLSKEYDWGNASKCIVGHLYQVVANLSSQEVAQVLEGCISAKWRVVALYSPRRFTAPLIEAGFDAEELGELEQLKDLAIREAVGIDPEAWARDLSRFQVAACLREKAKRCRVPGVRSNASQHQAVGA